MPMPPMPTKWMRWIFANMFWLLATSLWLAAFRSLSFLFGGSLGFEFLGWTISRARVNSSSQLDRHLRDVPRGIGMRQSLGGAAHLLEVFAVGKEIRDRFGQTFPGQGGFFQYYRGSSAFQGLGIDLLMVIGSAGKRDKNGGLAGRSDFCH